MDTSSIHVALLDLSVAPLAAGDPPWQPFLRKIQHRLNGAAEVHQAEGDVVNIAAKHIGGKVLFEGEECDRWEVVEHYDGQDNEDHLEGFLLHGMHGISARPRLPQHPEDRYVAVHHEGERSEDHHREDPIEVNDVSCAFGSRVGQNDHPDHNGQDCPVQTVLELSEDDGVDHGHVAVQADAGEEEGRGVFHAVEEAQDVPGAGGRGEEDEVYELQGRDETEEDVQNCQMKDEDVRGGRVAFVLVDEPQHCDIGWDA